MTRKRIDLMFDPATINRLDALLKEAKKLGHNHTNRSRLLEQMIMERDPEQQCRAAIKQTQIDLMQLKDRLVAIQEAREKYKK